MLYKLVGEEIETGQVGTVNNADNIDDLFVEKIQKYFIYYIITQ